MIIDSSSKASYVKVLHKNDITIKKKLHLYINKRIAKI